jgi:hypothetical protein
VADSISSITSVQLRDSRSIGGQRFTIRRQLGAGNMGIVYEAHDRERDEVVALKTLLHAEASALYRFKREFRALADIHHRNLVALHELVVDDQTCFFTMECVEGVSFLEHLRPTAPALDSPTLAGHGTETLDVPTQTRTRAQVAEHRDADFINDDTLAFDPSLPGTSQLAASLSQAALDPSLSSASLGPSRSQASLGPSRSQAALAAEPDGTGAALVPSLSQAALAAEPDGTGAALVPSLSQAALAAEPDGTGADHAPLARRRDLGPLDVPRLRAALAQLADGVVALHRAGIVHRDLKPSNVLVANDGRVVILDFGLATELSRPDAPEGEDDGITGTAAYMAPEQVTQGRGVAASDWYAVGVMLYEALSGERPYTGPLLQVLLAKRSRDPTPLAELVPQAPADLISLCERLMQRDPAARPDDAEVLRLLGRVDAGATIEPCAALVGRGSHLQALRDAFAATARGQAVAVHVHGPSGAGKSALVRGFLEELAAAEPRPVILSGRCYVRESVPYKALDPVVDSLSRFLIGLPADQARVLMPRDLWALARVFPVMRTIVDELQGHNPAATVLDQVELRRRAFAALRDLLGRLADRRRVVITIDDLQWADADSSALLEGLLRPPNAPALLLLTSFRSEELEHQPFLRELLAATDGVARRALPVGPLSELETRRLVLDLIGDPDAAQPFIQRIIRESAGSPFLAEQLARYVSHEPGLAATGISLAEMLDAQIRPLPAEARPLLDLLALAAHPLRPELAFAAAGLRGDERPLIKTLRAAKLVRITAGSAQIELYHDRIRETLAARIGPERRPTLHANLADALVAAGHADPELLFVHHHAAGQVHRAMSAAIAAATKAAAALAFDQAAQFYRHALALGPDAAAADHSAPPDRAALEEGLADALANAGRCQPAAAAYQRAAAYHNGSKALDLRRLAAEQLLVSGHVDEGRAVLQGVLAQIGMKLAPTPRRALLSLIARRLQLKLHGMRYKLRPEAEVAADELLRIDICSVVSRGLSMNDNIRAADFQALGTLLALRAGEPLRLARALGMEASFVASSGGVARTQATRLAQSALDLARQLGQPGAIAQALLSAGTVAYLAGGEWRRAASLCGEGEAIFRDRVPGSTWAKTTIRRFWLGSLMYLGELAELRRRLDEFLGDARDRGNRYALTDMRARLNLVWLIADEPAEGRRQLDEAMRDWTTDGYHVQHFNALLSRVQADLYEADPAGALRRIEQDWPALTGSLLMRIQLVRAEAYQLRARATLARIAGTTPGRDAVQSLRRDIDLLTHEKVPWIDAIAALLRAGLARVTGDPAAARTALRAAIAGFQAQDMQLHAAVARRQLGRLLGGAEGERLLADAESWMATQTIRDPSRIARVFAPGLE